MTRTAELDAAAAEARAVLLAASAVTNDLWATERAARAARREAEAVERAAADAYWALVDRIAGRA